MSDFFISSSSLEGTIKVPPSKSQTLRAILFASLGKGNSTIFSPLESPDTHAMIRACESFGALISKEENALSIKGVNGTIPFTEDVIQSGNSGIVLRFCTAIGALSPSFVVVTGDHSIRHLRPIAPLLSALRQLGASVETLRSDELAPVIVRGPIHSGNVVIDGQDSQPVSALLIAAAFVEGKTTIAVENPGEKPWVEMTLEWLKRLNISVSNENYKNYTVIGKASYNGFHYDVPGDWSSAAFPIGAALTTKSKITIDHVDFYDSQGDKKIVSALEEMGAFFSYNAEQKRLFVDGSTPLKGIEIDINDFIDALPLLAAVACYAKGKTRIFNAANARKKESNRIFAISEELKKMGAKIEETADGLLIEGAPLTGAITHSHSDHRIAMALTIAALGAKNETQVKDIESIAKTYPTFYDDFKKLGAHLKR